MEKSLVLQSTDISNKLIQQWELDLKEAYCIGRNIDKSKIVINDSTISRVHAELTFKYPKIFLKDLGSANGTFLNGKLIEKNITYEISLGSNFILGDSKILLRVIEKTSVPVVDIQKKSSEGDILDRINSEEKEKKFLKEKRKKSRSKVGKKNKKHKKTKRNKRDNKAKSQEKSNEKAKTSNDKEEKLFEYLVLREKEKKNKSEFNLEDILRNENPNLQQIKVGQKLSLIGKKGVSETQTRFDIKQWIRDKNRLYN